MSQDSGSRPTSPKAAPPVSTTLPVERRSSHASRNSGSYPPSATNRNSYTQVGMDDSMVDDTYVGQMGPMGAQPYVQQGSIASEPQAMYSNPSLASQSKNGGYGRGGEYVANMPTGSMGSSAGQDSQSPTSQGATDPFPWMSMNDVKEMDDDLHDPTKRTKRVPGLPQRALLNLGTLFILLLAVLMLFAGYPILHYFRTERHQHAQTEALANGHFQKQPALPNGNQRFPMKWRNTLIDPHTPQDAYTIKSQYSKTPGKELKLVFSDEFNVDGRSFYPGDDPYWEAVNLHYWATNNFEWYDPEAVTTYGGKLRIHLEQTRDHNLNFRGGMLQSWNKFCYQGGLLIASIQLPGRRDVGGLWPAFWIMGNLGRGGYGATVEGNWPYSYNYCDVGTLINQTDPATGVPEGNGVGGNTMFNQKHHTKALSFLPGQRLSACTCPGEDHPGPKTSTGFAGRAVPELDVFEAQYNTPISNSDQSEKGAGLSQSYQIAPYNYLYNLTQDTWNRNTTPCYHFFDTDVSNLNSYTGEVTQQSISGTSLASQTAVQMNAMENGYPEDPDKGYATYSVEYGPGEDGFVSWTGNGKSTWEVYPEALRPDTRSQVKKRSFPEEPMYILLNLGISMNFVAGGINWEKLQDVFKMDPNQRLTMSVDWVRVYQDPNEPGFPRVGCDPPDHPTRDYIERHKEAYTNANLTTWGGTREEGGYGANWPRNRLYNKGNGCKGKIDNLPGDPNRRTPGSNPPYPTAKWFPKDEIKNS